MRIIQEAISGVAAICGAQRAGEGEYKYSQYCFSMPCQDGTLLYHTMTGELLLLENGESLEELQNEMVARRYLVPANFDEFAYCRQLLSILSAMQAPKAGISSYTVFTTTDCNARCFYCYELGRKRLAMSEEIAHQTAQFMTDNHGESELELRWFGGEPLFNRRAIEIITEDLTNSKISFHSQMTTNGYLFDEETVQTAKEKWKLRMVQISLDGTEEIYNRSKAYIYRDGSAYQRVLRNIGLLLDAGIAVYIRLNTDEKNWENLMELTRELHQRFGGRKGLRVYPALLQDFGGLTHDFATEAERQQCFEELTAECRRLGLAPAAKLQRKVQLFNCMADDPHSLTVLPDGRLGKCEHESEEKLVGNLQEGIVDRDMYLSWTEKVRVPECENCPLFPQCTRLKLCAWNHGECTAADREQKRIQLEGRIRASYECEKNEEPDGKPTKNELEFPEIC